MNDAIEFLIGAIFGLSCGILALIVIGMRGWWCERGTSAYDLMRGNGLRDCFPWEEEDAEAA